MGNGELGNGEVDLHLLEAGWAGIGGLERKSPSASRGEARTRGRERARHSLQLRGALSKQYRVLVT